MQEVKVFNSEEFGSIRGVEVDGKSYVVANDVAKALGYTNPSKATNDHCKKSKMVWGNDSLGRRQQFKVIPEGDIYRLIVRSKLPSAQKFEEWVMDEVLPQIRRTGGYIPYNEEDDDKTILAKAVAILNRTVEEKNNEIEKLEVSKKELESKFNQLGIKKNTIDAVAAATNKPRKQVKQWIFDNGWLSEKNGVITDWDERYIYIARLKDVHFTNEGLDIITKELKPITYKKLF